MRRKGRSYLRKGKIVGIRNPFWIAGHLGITRNHTALTGGTEAEPCRLWDAWRYAYPEIRPATHTFLIE